MSALEFILLVQLDALLSNLNQGFADLLSSLIVAIGDFLGVVVDFIGAILPPYTAAP